MNLSTFCGHAAFYIFCGFALPTVYAPALQAAQEGEINEQAGQAEKGKQDFVQHMAQDAISILYDSARPFDQRKVTLENAFHSVVDVPWIARFVLGRNWQAANAEQRERYTTLYRRYLIKTYISNFSENPEKKIRDIKVKYIGQTQDERFSVRTEMLLADGNTVKVDYTVRDKNNRYKVIDVAVEGVSLLVSHRAALDEIAARQGIEGVIHKLEQVTQAKSYTVALTQ